MHQAKKDLLLGLVKHKSIAKRLFLKDLTWKIRIRLKRSNLKYQD